jgi:two-component sensor histidine kinase
MLSSSDAATVVDSIMASTLSGLVLVSGPDNAKILRVSDYAARMVGRPRSDLEGRTVEESLDAVPVFDEDGRRLPDEDRSLRRALRGETVCPTEVWLDADNARIPTIACAAPILNWRGELIGAIVSVADARPAKVRQHGLSEAVAQREALYRELTHRVKNHLQLLSARAALDARNPKLSTKELADQLKGQLLALAAVYRVMDQAEMDNHIEAARLLQEVCKPYSTDGVSVKADVEPPDLKLTPELAGPIAMLVNEAVCNSSKHAFPDHHGHIHISLTRSEPGRLRMEAEDDGVGWGAVDHEAPSHGLDLMRLFARQMHGDLELSISRQGGALVKAEMPEAAGGAAGR